MENQLDRLNFTSREEYAKALKGQIEALNQFGDFEIFLHQVSPSFVPNDDPRRIAGTRETMTQIMESGLDLSQYGSLCGTAMHIGSSSDFDVNKIIDYCYYYNLKNRGVCICAIPKIIAIDGMKFDYMTAKYSSEAYTRFKTIHRFTSLQGEHIPRTFFDCIKRGAIRTFDKNGQFAGLEYGTLPKEYMLGFQEIIPEDSSYRLILPNTHLTKVSQAHRDAHLREVATKIMQYFVKYDTDDTVEVFFGIMEEDEKYWEEKEWQDDSGW